MTSGSRFSRRWQALTLTLTCVAAALPGLRIALAQETTQAPATPPDPTPPVTAPPTKPTASEPVSQAPNPLAITISGGGTLGAYMGGELYYTGLTGRLMGDKYRPKVFTGASAGSINAFISVMTTCTEPQPDPTRSAFWQVWIPSGIHEFFSPTQKGGTSLLTPAGFDAGIAHLRTLWDEGLPTECDLLFGMAITRAKPLEINLAPGFPAIPRSLETVMLRITGRGKGRPPQLANYFDPGRVTPQVLLPLDGNEADPFSSLKQLALASSAFPLGFPPVAVRHCLRGPGEGSRCTPAEARDALFIDGGVFDNQPLGLAVRAMRGVQIKAGRLTIADQPGEGPLPRGAQFYFLDPRVKAYPGLPPSEKEPVVDDVFGVLTGMFRMIDSARSSELISIFDRTPEIRDRLLLARTFFPPASGTFTGFLDRSLREFDFYLGMYDAARTLREHPLSATWPRPEEEFLRDTQRATRKAWRPFFCLRAVLDGVGDPQICEGDDLVDFRILLQLSLDQLTDTCRLVAQSGAEPTTKHRQCLAVMMGGPAPRVPGVSDLDDAERLRRPNEGLLQHQLRLLGHYGFLFRDLGLTRAQSREATARLIRLGHRMVRRLSETQPRNGLLVGVLGRVGVDSALGYLPPEHIIHLIFGLSAEAGYSSSSFGPNWLRLGVALGLDGFSTLLNANDNYMAIMPKGGLEIEVLGGSRLQFRLGARAGYQFSTADSLLSGRCDFERENATPCSRFVSEAYASATVLGLLRVQIAGVYAPALRKGQRNLFALNPMLGLQINSPF